MNLDDFKPQWQQRQRDLDRSVDHVIKNVRSRMSSFDRTIWFRDMREAFAAALLSIWYSFDLFQAQNWLGKIGAGIGILACVIIVLVLYWAQRKGKVARTDLPLEDYCKAELTRVDRQIWLLRNVHWWYLGPLFVAIVVQIAGKNPSPSGLIFLLFFVLPLFGFVYWLNRVAVRFQLLPLRRELTSAINNDKDLEVSSTEPKKPSRRTIAIWFFGLLLAFGVGGYLADSFDVSKDAPKVSPFTEVTFIDQQIIVTYEKESYQWLELDGIKVEDIVAAAKKKYWGRWQKRVREDLVDVLWSMDHHPTETVQLRLRNLETGEQRVVEEAPLTEDNRSAVH